MPTVQQEDLGDYVPKSDGERQAATLAVIQDRERRSDIAAVDALSIYELTIDPKVVLAACDGAGAGAGAVVDDRPPTPGLSEQDRFLRGERRHVLDQAIPIVRRALRRLP
jgi:hypothetical protein